MPNKFEHKYDSEENLHFLRAIKGYFKVIYKDGHKDFLHQAYIRKGNDGKLKAWEESYLLSAEEKGVPIIRQDVASKEGYIVELKESVLTETIEIDDEGNISAFDIKEGAICLGCIAYAEEIGD
ncbi:MAG: hypothetical protein K0R02_434 [Rickettsiaceae bacterium]|jgi:hypothetical protein|nr:hypothetical protein [Rickettsiaceae bacterium]